MEATEDWLQVAIIDAEVRRGLLLLRPENLVVLGGKVGANAVQTPLCS